MAADETTEKPFDPKTEPEFPSTDETGEVDISLLWHNLSLSVTARIEQNDRFAEFVTQLREAGRRFYGRND